VNEIPPVDLSRQYQLISDRATAAVIEILHSGRYIGGEPVISFEKQFADYIGTANCVGCNSGTDALYLALKALDIGAGDEVITTPFTFIATSEVIVRVGAKPVFVDIDAATFNLDLDLIAAAITPQTKAIIPVHLFGQPIDLTRLMAIAKAYNLYVIEDCAQATGAKWGESQVGSVGDFGCFSFFPTKNLGGCGDGGALTTNNSEMAAKIKMLREHGLVRDNSRKISYQHDFTGINSRLDAIQAAILSIKLPHLDDWNQQRQQAADYYRQLLQPIDGIELPSVLAGGTSVWNQYTIRILDREAPRCDRTSSNELPRDLMRRELEKLGVIAMVYYPLPLHLQPVYRDLNYRSNSLPVVEQAAREVLSLPLFPGITREEQERVVYSLKDSIDLLGHKN
jgi:dTDP-4-amino-4,6-dideoxygalactose transaminase